MGTLVLNAFRCLEVTGGSWDDSPYFLVFKGVPGQIPKSDTQVVRRESWDDGVSKNQLVTANINVFTGVDSDTLILAALIEEDDGPDFVGGDLTKVKNFMNTYFLAYGGVSGIESDKSCRRDGLRTLFSNEGIQNKRRFY